MPVVATAVGGVADVVEDGVTGLLAPIDDGARIADAVVTLLRNPVRAAAMGRAGRRRAAAYDVRRLVADVESLYETLLRDRGRW